MENKCKYCNKIFKHKSNLYHHQLHRCRKRPDYKSKDIIISELTDKIKIKDEKINSLSENINKLKKINNEQVIKLKILKKKLKDYEKIRDEKCRLEGEVKVYKKLKIKLKPKIKNTITNNTTNNNNTVNINIMPAPFLKYENIDMIEKLLPGFLWNTITKRPALGIQDILENTTFNPKFPALNSVFLNNINKPYLLVSNGKGYECKPKKEIITKLIDNASGIYERYYYKIRHKLEDNKIWKAKDYISKLDEQDKYTIDKITKKIECLMIDLRKYINTEEWKTKIEEQIRKLEELHRVIEEEKKLLKI